MSVMDGLLLKNDSTWSLFKKSIMKKIKAMLNQKTTDQDIFRYFDLFISWLSIDDKFVS